jgi:nucleotide-binding universal stress UspA family protein
MKILLGIDDCHASRLATAFTRENFPHADVHVFSVADIHSATTMYAPEIGRVDTTTFIEATQNLAKDIVRHAEVGFEHADSATITTTGSVGKAICDEASKVGAELVIVGQSHHSLASRWFNPHVATYVLKHSTSPVLIVKAAEQLASAQRIPVTTVA